VLINATADVCGFFNGTNKDPLTAWIYYGIRDALPADFFHPCPFFSILAFNNIHIKSYKDEIFPDGLYLIKMHFLNNRDVKVFLLKLVLEARRTGLGNSRF